MHVVQPQSGGLSQIYKWGIDPPNLPDSDAYDSKY